MIMFLILTLNLAISWPMDGRNCTANARLPEQMHCPSDAVETFQNTMGKQIWLGNALLLASPGIMGVLVGIGGYGRCYRHLPFTRFIFLGANTLFLPIISYVVSTLGDRSNDYVNLHNDCITFAALCHSNFHPCMVITWAFLVQIAALNTTSVVSINRREGRKVGPPLELLVKGIWTFYLGASITKQRFLYGLLGFGPSDHQTSFTLITCTKIMFAPFAILCAKIWFKCYAFEKARLSFALARNPSLIFGYMQQLQQQEGQHGEPSVGEEAPLPPPLLVMGEDRAQVEKQREGYVFSNESGAAGTENIGLVTLDRVWQLDNVLPTSTPRLKDLCLSFALFKLLRCRFAKYKITNSGSTKMLNFFWSLLLQNGEHDRVFRVIADELSFLHDYYYSSHPTSYVKFWLPILGIFISLLSIYYCIVAPCFIVMIAAHKNSSAQIHCWFWCHNAAVAVISKWHSSRFGSLYFDMVPVFLLLALVLITEMGEISPIHLLQLDQSISHMPPSKSWIFATST